MLKIRRSHARLTFNIVIPIFGKDGFILKQGPDVLVMHNFCHSFFPRKLVYLQSVNEALLQTHDVKYPGDMLAVD